MVPVVCSDREFSALLYYDGPGFPTPDVGFRDIYLSLNIGRERTLVYDPSFKVTVDLYDRERNLVRTITSQDYIWKPFQNNRGLINRTNNSIYIPVKVGSGHPQNISGNDYETWIGEMDLLTGFTKLVARISHQHIDRIIEILEVNNSEIILTYSANAWPREFRKIDIATHTNTIVWDTGEIGSFNFSHHSNHSAYLVEVAGLNLVCYEYDYIAQSKIERWTIDLATYNLNISAASGFLFENSIVRFVASSDSFFWLFTLNENGEVLSVEDGTTILPSPPNAFIDDNQNVFVGGRYIYSPVPIKSTNLIRSNGNILGV